ncbi:hypothetical protein SAMN03159343_0129 [Klenkia marina]|uniref:Uncharacterized protein n=1 Tax=Klenkia marina TaxID=1960309 RepID=A0A1G4X8L5_9ACTN|nr:hypothetical protein [Klenkia marina]SCX37536.1 hypothetical protein SAMN03159343_0129 [Klenkia marina]
MRDGRRLPGRRGVGGDLDGALDQLPGADHLAVVDQHRQEDSVAPGDDGVEPLGGDHVRAVGVAEQQLVEPGQRADAVGVRRRGVAEGPEHLVAAAHLGELVAHRGEAGAHLGQRQPAPPRQVALGCRAVPGEVPPHQDGDRTRPVGRRRTGRPLVEQDEGLHRPTRGLPARRPQAQQALVGEPAVEVRGALTGHVQPCRSPAGGELGAGEGTTAGQLGAGHVGRPGDVGGGDAQLTVPGLGGAHLPVSGERQQQPQIGGGGGEQGAAHRPRAHDPAGGERGPHVGERAAGDPGADRPLGLPQVLGLHGEQPAHGRGTVGPGHRQALGGQPHAAQRAHVDVHGAPLGWARR